MKLWYVLQKCHHDNIWTTGWGSIYRKSEPNRVYDLTSVDTMVTLTVEDLFAEDWQIVEPKVEVSVSTLTQAWDSIKKKDLKSLTKALGL